MSSLESNALLRIFPATAGAIALGRLTVADLAWRMGATECQLDAIRLAVSEALTNAVVHAYDEVPGEISLAAGMAGEDFWIMVTDDGCGHRTPSSAPGLGWGLSLIAEASDAFGIAERADGGTEVQMSFRLPAGSRGTYSGPSVPSRSTRARLAASRISKTSVAQSPSSRVTSRPAPVMIPAI